MTTGAGGRCRPRGTGGVLRAPCAGFRDRSTPNRSSGKVNLIYDITDGTQHWILRRPPLGLVAPSANDIGHEYRVVKALGPTSVPVARAIAYCDDPAVIGAPFSVVSKVEGRVIRSAADGAALDPADPRAIADALIRGLVAVHGVAYQEVGLGDVGRPTGYLARPGLALEEPVGSRCHPGPSPGRAAPAGTGRRHPHGE